MVGKFLSERYELLEKIGEGGMAEVYKAKCHVLQRYVAVKILKSQFNEDDVFIEKFDKESKSAARLNHPNIVNIYDVGREGEIRYIVMEYIDGKTLKKYIKENNGSLNEREAISISLQIASALEHAHKNGIIHRDIKPHNIMISKDGIAKVADFGIAQAISSSTIVQTKEMLGTVHYSSPEQTRGSFVDHRTDVYSLGIVMYEMVTGKLPFVGDNAITIALKHMKEEVLAPCKVNKDISKGFENIILKTMKKSADYRYQTISELFTDLTLVLNNPSEKISYSKEDYNSTMSLPDLEELDNMSKANSKKKKHQNKSKISNLSMVSIILLALLSATIIFGIIGVTILKDRFSYQEVPVPNVVNMSFEEAKTKLNEIGFYIEEEGVRFSNITKQGFIIEQSEEPGKILKEGFTIKVIVSKGRNLVTMPNLLQKDVNEAEIVLQNKELVIGNIEYVANDLPKGYVVDQSPKAGTEVELGTFVDLVVSHGNSLDEYLMPLLLGLSFDEALSRFEGQNIGISVENYIYSDYDVDLIAYQDIKQGTTINPGTTIIVSLSNGPEPEKMVKKVYKFYTSFFENETETVVVEVVKGDETRVAYQADHNKSEGEFIITIEASGEVVLNIYFGDTLYNSIPENF